MRQYRQHKFFKKSKIPFSNLSRIYSTELYLGQKKAWQRPFFLTYFSKTVARELEHNNNNINNNICLFPPFADFSELQVGKLFK